MLQTVSRLLPELPLILMTAVATHLVMSFAQTLMHYKLGHHPIGGKFFRNHINFHHAHYSKDHLVSRTYLGDEGNNTPFFFIPVFLVGACTYLVLPVDLFVAQLVACAASFYAHVFFDKEYHMEGSRLQRFAWFRRKQELHFVHHRHANSNFAVIHFFWDRILGTYRRPDAAQTPQTVVRAPTDGYVTQLFLSPGMMAVPLALRPVMVFVHSHDNLFAVAFQQNALQRVRVGDEAEIAFDAIPGRVFKGRIKRVIDAVSQFVADAHGSQSMPDGNAIDLIPIADKVARGLIPRECLCDLARDPVRGRMRCDVDPDEVSAGQPHDDEGIEQVEAKGRGAHAAGRRLMRAARSCYAFVSALSPTTRSCSSLALLMRYSNSRPL
jgi:hypothetical protein